MRDVPQIETTRVLLRRWAHADREPFARMNADPRVMQYFPGVLSRQQSDLLADRIQQHFEERGFGLWALEIPGVAPFAGFVGLCVPGFEASFTPCVEIGWRLATEAWGRGYATEAARAVLHVGFDHLGLPEIVSFTVPDNRPSRRVMEKIGMTHDPADEFEHPNLPASCSRRRHVLYRLRAADFKPQPASPRR